jgi:hypothetical protein
VDVAAGLVGLAVGIVVGPVADRLATNAPRHDPLLGSVPRSPRLLLVSAATAVLGGACGLVYGFSLEAVIATVFCWVLVIVTRSDFETRLIPDKIILPGPFSSSGCARSTIRASSGFSPLSARDSCSS